MVLDVTDWVLSTIKLFYYENTYNSEFEDGLTNMKNVCWGISEKSRNIFRQTYVMPGVNNKESIQTL